MKSFQIPYLFFYLGLNLYYNFIVPRSNLAVVSSLQPICDWMRRVYAHIEMSKEESWEPNMAQSKR